MTLDVPMLALAAAKHAPDQRVAAISPLLGYLLLAAAACLFLVFVAHREAWRRLWSGAEDPRSIGVFRILFGLCALANVNGLWELFDYLFTDEGLFMTDAVRQHFAARQFAGFGNGLDGDPYGFFDATAVFTFLKGPRYSLLYFWDSPTAFWIHLVAFEVAMVSLIVGFQTRYVKWIAWFLFHSIIQRNFVFWEGTENVYRTLFFYLALSRCGHAYSVDNWLRCRKLRKLGRLSEPGGHADGAGCNAGVDTPALEPVYRLVPTWPRLLVILQVATVYCYTGVVKTGPVWMRGDAFYYALNLDHFWRFPPQGLSAIFGTNLFRVNTHVTHFWEATFPLVVFGLATRWILRERPPTPSPGWTWVLRFAWIGALASSLAAALVGYSVMFGDRPPDLVKAKHAQWTFAACWIGGATTLGWLYFKLRHRPSSLSLGKLPWPTRGLRNRMADRVVTFDLYRVTTWLLGRRVWLLLGFVFHAHLIIMMNIGWFSPGLLAAYACFLNGEETEAFVLALGRSLHRMGVPIPPRWRRTAPVPAATPTLAGHHRDGARLPMWVLVASWAWAIVGVPLQAWGVLHYGWTLVILAAFLVFMTQRTNSSAGKVLLDIVPQPGSPPPPGQPRAPTPANTLSRPWAYGPWGRMFANAIVIYHITAVACWLLPDKDAIKPWRKQVQAPFRQWLTLTQTTQGWKMFAPNPPRSNLFMRVLVTERDGNVVDLNTDIYHPSKRPIPWIWYTRERKINRRIAGSEGGKGSWYAQWHARYICRKWELDHGGVAPKAVELVKLTYPIPPPAEVAKRGPYDAWEKVQNAKLETFLSIECAHEPDAQLPAVIRQRHGLPPGEVPVRRWDRLRRKLPAWKRKQAEEQERDEPLGD